MVIDGREIRNFEELQEFCNSVIAQAKAREVAPSRIILSHPVLMRVVEREQDGRVDYDVETRLS